MKNPNKKLNDLLQTGISLHQQGSLKDAEDIYLRILKQDPNHFDALQLMGAMTGQQKFFERSSEYFSLALKINRTNPAVLNNYANILQSLLKKEEAIDLYNEAISLDKNYWEAFCNRGKSYLNSKNYELALQDFNHVILNRGVDFDLCLNKGNALKALNQNEEAIIWFSKGLELNPRSQEILNNLGNVYRDLEDFDLANKFYQQAINLGDPMPGIYINQGTLLQNQGSFELALQCFEKAIEIDSKCFEAFFYKAGVFTNLKRHDEAIECFDEVIRLNPEHVAAFNNRGNAYFANGNYKDALENYYKATVIDVNFADAFNNQGVILQTLGFVKEALASYQKAIEVDPKYLQAYYNAGDLFLQSKKYEEAFACFEYALLVNEDYEFLLGNYLHIKMFRHDWFEIDEWLKKLKEKIEQRKRVVTPFPIVGLIDSGKHQRIVSEVWGSSKIISTQELPSIPKRSKKEKIRIGYYSADYHDHATMCLMAELFELHDKTRFEIIAFSFDLRPNDEVRERVMKSFDRFFDVSKSSPFHIAQLSRELEIDIAIDLKGYTSGARTEIFNHRAAPIQVNYLGYPGTMGLPNFEYIISDPVVIPESHQVFYSEKVAYLPNSYQVNDRKRLIADYYPTRKELDLPDSGFVFCSFNNPYKITPETFSSWVEILNQVEGSVLWLLGSSGEQAQKNLKHEAEKRGVSPSRIIFAPPMRLPFHLARCRAADLFLDNLPCNAHTTASDALWAGLPLITLIGESFSGRVAASLLTAVDLPELITDHKEGYINLAVELAKDSTKLESIRRKLKNNIYTSPLFDTPLYTKNLESLYIKMYERYHDDLPLEHIYLN